MPSGFDLKIKIDGEFSTREHCRNEQKSTQSKENETAYGIQNTGRNGHSSPQQHERKGKLNRKTGNLEYQIVSCSQWLYLIFTASCLATYGTDRAF